MNLSHQMIRKCEYMNSLKLTWSKLQRKTHIFPLPWSVQVENPVKGFSGDQNYFIFNTR